MIRICPYCGMNVDDDHGKTCMSWRHRKTSPISIMLIWLCFMFVLIAVIHLWVNYG